MTIPGDLVGFIAALRLSERERVVLELMLQGRSNKQIADAVGLLPQTVKNYTARLRGAARAFNIDLPALAQTAKPEGPPTSDSSVSQ